MIVRTEIAAIAHDIMSRSAQPGTSDSDAAERRYWAAWREKAGFLDMANDKRVDSKRRSRRLMALWRRERDR